MTMQEMPMPQPTAVEKPALRAVSHVENAVVDQKHMLPPERGEDVSREATDTFQTEDDVPTEPLKAPIPSKKRVREADAKLVAFLKDRPELYGEIHSEGGSDASLEAWEQFAAEHPEDAAILEEFGYKKYEEPEDIHIIASMEPMEEELDEEQPEEKPKEDEDADEEPVQQALKNVLEDIKDIPGAQAWIEEEIDDNGRRMQVIKRYIPGEFVEKVAETPDRFHTDQEDFFTVMLYKLINKLDKLTDKLAKGKPKQSVRVAQGTKAKASESQVASSRTKRGIPIAAQRLAQQKRIQQAA